MLGGAELLLAGAAIAVAFAVPVALVLWMAAQFIQSRALERRVTALENAEREAAAPAGTADSLGTEPLPEETLGEAS